MFVVDTVPSICASLLRAGPCARKSDEENSRILQSSIRPTFMEFRRIHRIRVVLIKIFNNTQYRNLSLIFSVACSREIFPTLSEDTLSFEEQQIKCVLFQ